MYFFKKFIFLLVIAWLVTRAILLGHEFVGHAMFAWLFGANVTDVSLSWFSGGRVSYDNTVLQTWQHITIMLGGIFFQLIVATLVFPLKKRIQHRWLKFACSLFIAICIVHGFAYSSIGTFFDVGDGRIVAYFFQENHKYGAFFFLPFVGLATYFGAKELIKDSMFVFGAYGKKAKHLAVIQGAAIVAILIVSAYFEPKIGAFDRPPIILDSSTYQMEGQTSISNVLPLYSDSEVDVSKFFFLGFLAIATVGAGGLGIYRTKYSG